MQEKETTSEMQGEYDDGMKKIYTFTDLTGDEFAPDEKMFYADREAIDYAKREYGGNHAVRIMHVRHVIDIQAGELVKDAKVACCECDGTGTTDEVDIGVGTLKRPCPVCQKDELKMLDDIVGGE